MKRLSLAGAILFALFAATALWGNLAQGKPTVTAGNHVLLPNAAGQKVPIMIGGGDPIEGIDLYVQIGDGGLVLHKDGFPVIDGDDVGPIITAVDILRGTIFATSHTGARIEAHPLIWSASTTTAGASKVPADGLLATVTIDTTGFFGGTYPFSLTASTIPSPTPTWVANIPSTLVDGSLAIVPEPATVFLALAGAAGCAIVARRGRRK